MKPVDEIPYRRTYSRILVIILWAAVPIAALLPYPTAGIFVPIRVFVCTYGIGIASILCPTLVYAGLRTHCFVDVILGCTGLLTLIYWIPCVLLT